MFRLGDGSWREAGELLAETKLSKSSKSSLFLDEKLLVGDFVVAGGGAMLSRGAPLCRAIEIVLERDCCCEANTWGALVFVLGANIDCFFFG